METSSILILWIYTALCLHIVASLHDRGGCHIPEAFQGDWIEDGGDRVSITANSVSDMGTCSEEDGHGKFLLVSRHGCVKCMVFTPQHTNLLQYKKSYCGISDKFDEVCNSITSQAELHTLVREKGTPIPCPFQGHWDFTYTNHSRQCTSPKSEIAACADTSRAQFNFRRCPGHFASYDRSENFQCLATWDNGHDHFLYGKFTGSGPAVNTLAGTGSPYRCLMFTVTGAQGKMAMSADATCNDIQSYSIGPVEFDLDLRRDKRPQPRCSFPKFFPATSKWRDVKGSLKFEVDGRHDLFTMSRIPDVDGGWSERERRVACMLHAGETEDGTTRMVTFITNDKCESAYACVQFKKNSKDVLEVRFGQYTKEPSFACQESNFKRSDFHVLFPYTPKPIPCPHEGVHRYKDLTSGCSGKLRVGCQEGDEMEVEGRCDNHQAVEVLQCYASWKKSSTTYVLAGKLNDLRKKAYCLVYQEHTRGMLLESSDSCGVHVLTIMDSPIKFAVETNVASCADTTSRSIGFPDSNHPRDPRERDSAGSYHTNDQARDNTDSGSNRANKPQPEVIKTPSGTGVNRGTGPRQTSGIINADGDKNGASSDVLGRACWNLLMSLAGIAAAYVFSSHR